MIIQLVLEKKALVKYFNKVEILNPSRLSQ